MSLFVSEKIQDMTTAKMKDEYAVVCDKHCHFQLTLNDPQPRFQRYAIIRRRISPKRYKIDTIEYATIMGTRPQRCNFE